jgi:hypothetical protein
MAKTRETADSKSESLWQFVDRTAREVADLPAWVKGGSSERTEVCEPDTKSSTSTENSSAKLEV